LSYLSDIISLLDGSNERVCKYNRGEEDVKDCIIIYRIEESDWQDQHQIIKDKLKEYNL
jgi:hypothetical protein